MHFHGRDVFFGTVWYWGGVRTPFSGFWDRFNAVRIDGDAFGFCLEIFGRPGVLLEMV